MHILLGGSHVTGSRSVKYRCLFAHMTGIIGVTVCFYKGSGLRAFCPKIKVKFFFGDQVFRVVTLPTLPPKQSKDLLFSWK